MSEREYIKIPLVLKKAADALLRQAGGDPNGALSLAQDIEAQDEGQTDRDYWFAYNLRVFCHVRATAAYEGVVLIETIDDEIYVFTPRAVMSD